MPFRSRSAPSPPSEPETPRAPGRRANRRRSRHRRGRFLTEGEKAALSPGLLAALERAGTRPEILCRAHPGAVLASLWRGRIPVLTRGALIFWPGAPADAAADGRISNLALLQHELQHVLDYAEGRLGAVGYLIDPRNWSYRLAAHGTLRWETLGAEQRAVAAERLLLAENGLLPAREKDRLEALLPWARAGAAPDRDGSAEPGAPPAGGVSRRRESPL